MSSDSQMGKDLAVAQICRRAPWPAAVLPLYGTPEGTSTGLKAGVNEGIF
jgi:hypothetical protein